MTEQISKAGRPKSEEKRTSIIRAATQLFLELGYTNTSMNQVANEAGVSKQTVYSHFKNKEALFIAVIGFKCEEYQLDKQQTKKGELSLKQVLHLVGTQFMSLMQDPEVIAMYRVVIGEAHTSPHVAELFYQAGPQNAMDMLAYSMLQCPECKLDEQDAKYWASAFFNLLKGEGHMCTLLGLPFKLDKNQQLNEVEKVSTIVIKMMDIKH